MGPKSSEISRAGNAKQQRACSQHLVNIGSLPLPVCEASCRSEASAVRNAKIELHVRMWPLFPECRPDVRLPGKDSGNAMASFFGASLLLPIWRRLPFQCTSWIRKNKNEKEDGIKVLGMNFLYSPSSKGFVRCYLDLNCKSETWSLSPLFNNIIKMNGGPPANGHFGVHIPTFQPDIY